MSSVSLFKCKYFNGLNEHIRLMEGIDKPIFVMVIQPFLKVQKYYWLDYNDFHKWSEDNKVNLIGNDYLTEIYNVINNKLIKTQENAG